MKVQEYDYVIIGGGSAGCTLAARLAEDPAVRVLLIEAGRKKGNLHDFWKIEMPAAFDHIWRNPKYNWMYEGEPEPTLNNRRIFQPRGKVLGGSSTINGLVFLRGHPLDFERWVREGAIGWSWNEVLPYFKRLETWEGGESDFRGGNGPVKVRQGHFPSSLYGIFLEAGEQAGFPITEDINGQKPEGFGALQMNVGEGRRYSTAQAYIRPNERRRPNLTIISRAEVTSLSITGNRVRGVYYSTIGRDKIKIEAAREVILCAGAINSPKILMLSGIGPYEHLDKLGIKTRVNLPGVGQNLQDHPIVYLKYEIDKPVSMSRYMRLDQMAYVGARWITTKTGAGTSNNVETGALVRSDSSVPHPDIEIQYIPVIMDHDYGVKPGLHGFTCCVGPTRTERPGCVRLRSSNPMDTPRIWSNFLASDYDLEQLIKSVEIGRLVASQSAYKGLGVKEVEPGPSVTSRQQIIEYLRSTTAGDFHLSGTCRMGANEDAVVDPQLRVHGIEGLRIVDASVMPSIVSANTNATTIMIAEKAADIIRGQSLPKTSISLDNY